MSILLHNPGINCGHNYFVHQVPLPSASASEQWSFSLTLLGYLTAPIAMGWLIDWLKLHLGYEECRGGGLQIIVGHLGIFNVSQNLKKWVFSPFASIRKAATAAKSNSHPWAQQNNALSPFYMVCFFVYEFGRTNVCTGKVHNACKCCLNCLRTAQFPHLRNTLFAD